MTEAKLHSCIGGAAMATMQGNPSQASAAMPSVNKFKA